MLDMLLKLLIENEIKKDLSIFFSKHGYTHSSAQARYTRNFPGGSHKIKLRVVGMLYSVELEPTFIIRMNEVEDIAQKYPLERSLNAPPPCTMNAQMDNFDEFPGYHCRTMEETKAALAHFKDVYITKIDPFLLLHSDINNMDRSINQEKLKIGTHYPGDTCVRSIIIARLAKNPDFTALAEANYTNVVNRLSGETADNAKKVEQFIQYLYTLK